MNRRIYAMILIAVVLAFLMTACSENAKELGAVRKSATEFTITLASDPDLCADLEMTECRKIGTTLTETRKVADAPVTYESSADFTVKGTDRNGKKVKFTQAISITLVPTADESQWQVQDYAYLERTPSTFGSEFVSWLLGAIFYTWYVSLPLSIYLIFAFVTDSGSKGPDIKPGWILLACIISGIAAAEEGSLTPFWSFIGGFIGYPIVIFIISFVIAMIVKIPISFIRSLKSLRKAPSPAPRAQYQVDHGKLEAAFSQVSDAQLSQVFERAKDENPELAVAIMLEMQRRGMRVPSF